MSGPHVQRFCKRCGFETQWYVWRGKPHSCQRCTNRRHRERYAKHPGVRASQTRATQSWIERNRERFNASQRERMKRRREKHPGRVRKNDRYRAMKWRYEIMGRVCVSCGVPDEEKPWGKRKDLCGTCSRRGERNGSCSKRHALYRSKPCPCGVQAEDRRLGASGRLKYKEPPPGGTEGGPTIRGHPCERGRKTCPPYHPTPRVASEAMALPMAGCRAGTRERSARGGAGPRHGLEPLHGRVGQVLAGASEAGRGLRGELACDPNPREVSRGSGVDPTDPPSPFEHALRGDHAS